MKTYKFFQFLSSVKKTVSAILFAIAICGQLYAQVGINSTNTPPAPSAMLDVSSTNKGLLIPRVANPATNIANPATGLMAYNTTTNTPNFYNGSQWQSVTAVSAASMGFKNMVVFYEGFNTTWLVPAGVNKVMIEAWGGGGGGGIYQNNNGFLSGSGAQAGTYCVNVADVTGGQNLIINVGPGGEGYNVNLPNSPRNGGPSSVVRNSQFLAYALGGESSILSGTSPILALPVHYIYGENGGNIELAYGNSSATDYNLIVKLGSGGSAYNGGKGGKGSWFVSKNSTSLLYTKGDGSDNAYGGIPGGGAGSSFGNVGAFGGKGEVIIYY